MNPEGLHQLFLEKVLKLRASYAHVMDDEAARMPLTYIQFVELLVDSLVVLSLFALYPAIGAHSILLTGLLTFFFCGLLELSKSFLDPFGNEDYILDNIQIDVLLAKVNAGSVRWLTGGNTLPVLRGSTLVENLNGPSRRWWRRPSDI